jgi:hypothetical protein
MEFFKAFEHKSCPFQHALRRDVDRADAADKPLRMEHVQRNVDSVGNKFGRKALSPTLGAHVIRDVQLVQGRWLCPAANSDDALSICNGPFAEAMITPMRDVVGDTRFDVCW